MTLTKILRTVGLAERATVHGFRSSFRDWAAECTSATYAAMELSLAHHVGNAVERAYARSDLLEQRRTLMDQWGEHVIGCGPPFLGLGVVAELSELGRDREIKAQPVAGDPGVEGSR